MGFNFEAAGPVAQPIDRMTPPTSVTQPVRRPVELGLLVAVLAVALGVTSFYYWTVQSAAADLRLHGQKNDYYNLLVDGFEEGHLYMKAEPDPRLLALPPAERPGGAPFMLDASLYQGRYYLYFGVAPVMTAILPYAVLTGHDLSEALAAVLFMVAGFGLGTAWWWEVRREFFPRLGGGWFLLGVVALGFCTAAPSALRRPLFYEVAIGAGYAFSMAALWAVTKAWLRPKQRGWWLALAGVAVGLAVGSRANLAPAGIALLVGAAVLVGRGVATRATLMALLAAGAGAGAVGTGLAAYNYARFGSVVEFGHHHQLGANPRQMFRAENLGYNLGLYYFTPPALNGYFPFVAPGDEPVKPDDYVGREQVHGQWPWTLLAGFALVAGLVAWERRERTAGGRSWTTAWALVGGWFLVNVTVVGLTGVRSNRYMVDFQPALVLATLVALAPGLAGRGGWSRLLGLAVVVLVPAAAAFNVLGSMQVHGFLRITAPQTYAALAARVDRWVWPWLAGESSKVGDRELELYWPKGNRGGRREPLLSTGMQDFRDMLLIDYNGAGKARVVFDHGEYGAVVGEWFAYTGGAQAKVVISGGPLLPPATHPWFGDLDVDERLALKRRLRVTIDGAVRLDRDVVSYDSSPSLQRWGEGRGPDGRRTFFSGTIERVVPLSTDRSWLSRRAEETGALRLRVQLPKDRYGWTEPLVQSGGAGAFDTLAVRYVRPGFVRLVHDQLGSGAQWSEDIAVDYEQPQSVEVSLPTANDSSVWLAFAVGESGPRRDRMRVRWNGQDVFRPSVPLMPSKMLGVSLGLNGWNASNLRMFFNGRLTQAPRPGALGKLRAGELSGKLTVAPAEIGERGLWLYFERSDGEIAALVWQRDPTENGVKIGWHDGERAEWLVTLPETGLAGLSARLKVPGAGESPTTWMVVEQRDGAVSARITSFFGGGAVRAWGLQPEGWAGSALGSEPESDQRPAVELPGRVRLRFILPPGGFTGGSPLLTAGRTGAADSVYLRGLGGGRYVVGLDHWGIGSIESDPFTLAAEIVHTLTAELGSLDATGVLPKDHVRFTIDSRVVLDVAQVLYPVQPDEIVFGKNPLGMSTSGAEFLGEILSVRRRVEAGEGR